MPSASPNASARPISFALIAPFSASSIVQAMVAPKLIGSIPYSLHKKLALQIAARLLTPQDAP